MTGTLAGRVVVVTGGSRNIGWHAAAALAGRGARVAITGRDWKALEAAARAIGGDTLAVPVDLADPEAVKVAIDAVAARCGRLDGLVNNAGVSWCSSIEKLDPAQVLEQVQVNFLAPVWACRAAIPHLRRAGGGRILNVSSATVHEEQAFAHLSMYSSTKAALEQFSKELREELRRDRIAVTTFVPGNTRTGFGDRWDPAAAGEAYVAWLEHGAFWAGMMEAPAVGEAIAACFDLPAEASLDFVLVRPVGRQPKVMEKEL